MTTEQCNTTTMDITEVWDKYTASKNWQEKKKLFEMILEDGRKLAELDKQPSETANE